LPAAAGASFSAAVSPAGPLSAGPLLARPLLFASRRELSDYALAEGLSWVEDSSNATDKYSRNFVRHRLVPLIQERYPSVLDNLADNLSRFREVEVLYRQALDVHRSQLLERRGADSWQISVIKLRKAVPAATVIYELLRPFGFTPAQSAEVRALLDSTSGHYITSGTHRVLRDRKMLIISSLPDAEHAPGAAAGFDAAPAGQATGAAGATAAAPIAPIPAVLDEDAPAVQFPGGELVQSRERVDPGYPAPIPDDPRRALLDAAHIRYPLILRRWKAGDYFYPLGMRKKKKLSRFFIDCKLSLLDKERTWVLESEGRILWVVGQRIDDRFRISGSTTEALRLEWRTG
jgi:tRNA(Ile)-lysidine synthase